MTTSGSVRLAGVLYLATFATSIPGLALKTAVLRDGAGSGTVAAAAALEILLAAACVGTALALLPTVRRVSESLAVGFVVSRTLEAAMILTGVLAVMAVDLVRRRGAADLVPALVALHDATFLIGPALLAAVNALLLGSLLWRGRLVPRVIPGIGLAGAPLLLASTAGVLLGWWNQTDAIAAVAALPIAAWEFTLGVWLLARGTRASVTAGR